MPYNGAGNFVSLPPPQYPAVPGDVIRAAYFNAVINDLIAGLTNAVTRDGQSPPTSNLPMAGKKHTGVADATATDQYASYGQLINGLANILFTAAGAGAVNRSAVSKMRDWVSVLDFGVIGDGVADDTAGIQAALAAAKHVIVPAGLTPLISATIAVPSATRLEFLGAYGNTSGQYPASYFIKKSTMTTPGITIAERGWVDGGGLVCQAGNTGDGVQLLNNSAKLSNFLVHGAGQDGVRVGQNAGANTNSFELYHVTSQYNTRYGIYVHDGKLAGVGADANAGTLYQCFVQHNGSDGIRLGHCFWNTLLNCLSEVNTGWGLYIDGADDGGGVPQARYNSIIGGDYNEGNTAGQIFDQGYFTQFLNPDQANVAVTTPGALPGSGLRNVLAPRANTLQGLTVKTQAGSYPATVDEGAAGTTSYSLHLKKQTTGGNGQGVGAAFDINDGTTQYNNAGSVRVFQSAVGQFGLALGGYKAGAQFDILELSASVPAVRPVPDNTISCGSSSQRWSVVYAATGSINTSDGAAKQDVRGITEVESAVAQDLKKLIRAYKFKDAVEVKGANARIHFGAVAQEVRDAFIKRGLNPASYAVFCSDTWYELDGKPVERDANGNYPEGAVEVTRLGLRYDELFAFIISTL